MLARFVRLEFSIRSGAGRLVMDESRATKPRKVTLADLEELSAAETLAMIRNAEITRAVNAPPADSAPIIGTDRAGRTVRMRRVAPIRDVAQVVKVRARNGGHAGGGNARDWRAEVSRRIAMAGAHCLVLAEELRQERTERRNQAAALERTVRRLKHGGRKSPERTDAELRLTVAQLTIADLSAQLSDLARTRDYRDAPDRLLTVCTETQELADYLLSRGT